MTATENPLRATRSPLRFVSSAASLALCLAATSCVATSDGESTEEEGVSALDAPLFVTPGTTLWNDNQLGTAAAINVCFAVRPRVRSDGVTDCSLQSSRDRDCEGNLMQVNGTVVTDTLRNQIRREVENTWQRYGNVEFVGWGDCPIDAATNKHKETSMPHLIAIQFGSMDVTNRLGKSATLPTIVQYNWAALSVPNNDLFNLVHEVGHALGFEHEWVRKNFSDPRCTKAAHPEMGTVDPLFALTSFADLNSKMNYCGFSPPDVTKLSPGDIIGLQKAYGRKYDGSVVGYRGQCVDIQGGGTADGTPTVAFPCRGAWNDTFFRNSTSTFEWFQTKINNKCLNVSGGTAPNPVIDWTCGSFENERFTTLGVEWRAMGNMCVQAVSGKLQLQECNGSSSQKWDFFHPVGLRDDQIRLAGSNSCVAATTSTGALGQELVLATCSTSDTKQRFGNPGKGLLTLKNNVGFCANVAGGLPTPGSKVVLWDGCSTTTPPYNSQFLLSGKIQSLNNCMQIQGAANPGDTIRAQACDSANTTTQIWEYYL